MSNAKIVHHFFPFDRQKVWQELGADRLLTAFEQMLLIRHFELRAEAAYQQGQIGGFFHSYVGQEAIQTAAVMAFGERNWWTTSYRCHALALLLGVTPEEAMAELYGRSNGNAKGRGGSMHLYADRMLGGFGIVTGQIPIATGAGFALRYQEVEGELSIGFLGDGAVAQGAFHESLNLASLWNLPCVYIIENNQWGMGTSIDRALSMRVLAEEIAPAYRMSGYTVDGFDLLACYSCFNAVKEEVLSSKRPVLIEAVVGRFKGHSVSDPGLYRLKEQLQEEMKRDPLLQMQQALEEAGLLSQEQWKELDKRLKQKVLAAMEYAEKSPWPSLATLESDVFAP